MTLLPNEMNWAGNLGCLAWDQPCVVLFGRRSAKVFAILLAPLELAQPEPSTKRS
jgi:hypothetical protein